jgi:hypothetical protein
VPEPEPEETVEEVKEDQNIINGEIVKADL